MSILPHDKRVIVNSTASIGPSYCDNQPLALAASLLCKESSAWGRLRGKLNPHDFEWSVPRSQLMVIESINLSIL